MFVTLDPELDLSVAGACIGHMPACSTLWISEYLQYLVCISTISTVYIYFVLSTAWSGTEPLRPPHQSAQSHCSCLRENIFRQKQLIIVGKCFSCFVKWYSDWYLILFFHASASSIWMGSVSSVCQFACIFNFKHQNIYLYLFTYLLKPHKCQMQCAMWSIL